MKKATKIHEQAVKLIGKLDELAANNNTPGTEVALVTSLGRTCSWQKKKLQNLEYVLEHGREIHGFVIAREDSSNTYHVTLRPWNMDDRVENLMSLIGSLGSLMEICECGPDEEDVSEDFSKTCKLCPECHHAASA